ncbi:MAG: hypothetical protein V1929_11275 [bacterium]
MGVQTSRDLDCLRCDRCRVQPARLDAGEVSPSRERVVVAYLAAVALAAAVFGYRAVDVGRGLAAQSGGVGVVVTTGREANIPAIRSLIEHGQLSGREARFYKPYVPPVEE